MSNFLFDILSIIPQCCFKWARQTTIAEKVDYNYKTVERVRVETFDFKYLGEKLNGSRPKCCLYSGGASLCKTTDVSKNHMGQTEHDL